VGVHTKFGELTVDGYLKIALDHDQDHLKSLERLATESRALASPASFLASPVSRRLFTHVDRDQESRRFGGCRCDITATTHQRAAVDCRTTRTPQPAPRPRPPPSRSREDATVLA